MRKKSPALRRIRLAVDVEEPCPRSPLERPRPVLDEERHSVDAAHGPAGILRRARVIDLVHVSVRGEAHHPLGNVRYAVVQSKLSGILVVLIPL